MLKNNKMEKRINEAPTLYKKGKKLINVLRRNKKQNMRY